MAVLTRNERLQAIKSAVDEAKAQGFPTSSLEEKEQYFLDQVSTGEVLSTKRASYSCVPSIKAQPSLDTAFSLLMLTDTIADKTIDAALAFYRALKVYPTPHDLINIYDNTVPKVCTALGTHSCFL